MIQIGDRIKNLRDECDWSQQDLARRIEVSKQAISNWERHVAKPDINQLVAIAEVFRVSTDFLLGLEDGPHFVHPQGSIKSRSKHWDWVFQKSYDLTEVLQSKYRFTLEGRILSSDELLYYTELIKTAEVNYRKQQERHEQELSELELEIERLVGKPTGNDNYGTIPLF